MNGAVLAPPTPKPVAESVFASMAGIHTVQQDLSWNLAGAIGKALYRLVSALLYSTYRRSYL